LKLEEVSAIDTLYGFTVQARGSTSAPKEYPMFFTCEERANDKMLATQAMNPSATYLLITKQIKEKK